MLATPSVFYGINRTTSSKFGAIEVLCTMLLVLTGCYRDTQKENNEVNSAQRPPDAGISITPKSEQEADEEKEYTADAKSETDGEIERENYDAGDAAIELDSSHDATKLPIGNQAIPQPIKDPPDVQCGSLQRLQNSEGPIEDAVAIRDGDGYATLAKSEPSDVASILYYIDTVESEMYQINTEISSVLGQRTNYITKTASSDEVLAVLCECTEKGGTCGNTLSILQTASRNTQEYNLDALFQNFIYNYYEWSLFAIAPDDTFVIGILRGSSLESASAELGLARLDRTGKTSSETVMEIESDFLLGPIQIESDERNRTIVLLESIEEVPIIGAATLDEFELISHSRFLVFDENFNLLNSWQPPQNILITAFSPIGRDRLLLVGGSLNNEQVQTWFRMVALDESAALTEVWPEDRIGDGGIAAAIGSTPSGEFVLAGVNIEGTPWLQRYDADGEPLWSQRIEANPEDGLVRPAGFLPDWFPPYLAAISVQSDDSILLTLDDQTFVYCE